MDAPSHYAEEFQSQDLCGPAAAVADRGGPRSRRTQLLEAIACKVRAQADATGGYHRLALGYPYSFLDIPRNPFILWALRGFAFERFGKVRPAWRTVSPVGLKVPHDDPLHTDWILGAGLSVDDTYRCSGETLTSIALRRATQERIRLIRAWAGCAFAILSAGKQRYFSGPPIVARPDATVPAGSIALAATAGMEYQAAMMSACRANVRGWPGLIICAAGGRLAHLSSVARELCCTVLLVEDALSKLQHARELSIDLEEGQLYVCPSALEIVMNATMTDR
jgi:hypothetical protein